MKKKIYLSAAFVISLMPMLLNQYGGLRGVQEITGLMNLLNPIGVLSVLLFIIGVWFPFKKSDIGKITGGIGTIGIVISEVYEFFTWHVMTVTGEVSLRNSIEFAFPEFYFGLVVSILMVVYYVVIEKRCDSSEINSKIINGN